MKLVILDRDGVINRDSDSYIKTPDEWQPIPGSIRAISALCQARYTVCVATNQSGVARGLYSEETLAEIHRKLTGLVEVAGGRIAQIAYCPHGPEDGCLCRKPLPGLIDQIVLEQNVPDNVKQLLVGDSIRDLQAGAARGFQNILVRTGNGEATIARHRNELPAGTLIADDLAAAVSLIFAADAKDDGQ